MGRKQHFDSRSFYGQAHEYTVSFMLDPADGTMHAGVCGKHVVAHTLAGAVSAIQEIIDTEETIDYQRYALLDLGNEPDQLVISALWIAEPDGLPTDRKQRCLVKHRVDGPAQWLHIHASWVVVDPREEAILSRNIQRIRDAQDEIDEAYAELNRLTRPQ